MCTVSLGAKSKILGGCSAEDDVTQPDAVVKDAREDVECTRASDTNMSKAQVALYFAAFFGAGLSMALPYGAIQLRVRAASGARPRSSRPPMFAHASTAPEALGCAHCLRCAPG